MPKTPRISGEKAVKAFKKAGFRVDRIRGSHHILKRGSDDQTLSIPVHRGKNVGTGLLASLIKAAGLTIEEFIEIL